MSHLARALACLCFLSSLASAQTWPPPGPGTWPPGSAGDLQIGTYTPDPAYTDANGDPFEPDMASGKLKDAVDHISSVDAAMGAEISAAYAQGAVGFLAVSPGQGAAGATDGDTVGLVLKGRSAVEVASTLAHEWTHLRRLVGANDGTPDSGADEKDPCRHTNAVCAASKVLSDIGFLAWDNGDPSPVPCSEVERLEEQLRKLTLECKAKPGDDTPDCEAPWPTPCN